jgi:phosphoribosylglycinamide formyltransferase-1
MIRLGLLASHNGSNLGAIIAACQEGRIAAAPVVVIGNNSGAFALERARRAGIPVAHLSNQTHPDPATLDAAMAATLAAYNVDLVVLAHWRGRILNVHPSLLPKFGGKGMYGERVHAAVIEAGDTVTGATIHHLTEEYDQGPIIAQVRVPVEPVDTAATLAARLLPHEHALYVETLARIARGDLILPELTIRRNDETGGTETQRGAGGRT